MADQQTNFNATTPAAPTNALNAIWQAAAPSTTGAARNASCYLPVFTGDSGSGGTIGLVPAPPAGSAAAGKVLKADGTWYVPPGVLPSGAANLLLATPNGSSGQASLRALVSADLPASPIFTGLLKAPHMGSSSGAPTIAAGAGAGSSPTVAITAGGTDLSGIVTVTTGTSPAGSNATIATITFSAAYGANAKVILTPANAAAAALSGASQVYAPAGSTTTMTIISGTTALAASTAYAWNYLVTQ